MTPQEFSDEFSTLLNSFGESPTGFTIELDEYEKSVFLTQAQEQIVVELYSGRNSKGASFEETEELRSNLRELIRTDTLTESTTGHKGVSSNSKFFNLPPDILFITYEFATLDDLKAGCSNGSKILVTPVTQDELNKVINNPFRWASKKRALRLDNGPDTVEIISKYKIKDYTIRYLSRPAPIVLTYLDEVSVNDENIESQCTLNPILHRPILERAVQLAILSKTVGINKQ